jgi:beta-lactamase class A
MIVESNNECSIAMAEKIGWGTIINEGKALGAADLDWSNNAWGSAHDCVMLLSKLARNEILTSESRDYLLGLMKRQNFRNGIPAGTSSAVADKVGFMDGQLNDAAIVYAPELTYVLVIYTKGQSWATIAEITRQIVYLAS